MTKKENKAITNRIKIMRMRRLNPFAIMEDIYYDFPKMSVRRIFELVIKTK